MILERRGLPAIGPQVAIAHDLGGNPTRKIGCPTTRKDHPLRKFFSRWGYSLQDWYRSSANFRTPKHLGEFLQSHLIPENDVLVCFWHPTLNKKPKGGGHIALVERVTRKHVFLCDPKRKHKHGRKVLLSDLFDAIQDDGKYGAVHIVHETK
jgi:hypothetical protein